MHRHLLTLTLAGFACCVAHADDKMMLTPAKLVGTYQITKGEKYGKDEPSDKIKDTYVKFTEEKITVVDADEKEVYVQNYKLDATTTPAKIKLRPSVPKVGIDVPGLIKMDGDKIMLIYALPEGEAPTEFKTKEKQLMFEMTKIKPKK